ncbi:MAG: hypothetical protein ACJ72L_11680 [Marmoricola sp.]
MSAGDVLGDIAKVVVAPTAIALAVPALLALGRRERLRGAREQLELARVLEQEPGMSEEAASLRRMGLEAVRRELRPKAWASNVKIFSLWSFTGVLAGLLTVAEMAGQAETGPPDLSFWIVFAVFGMVMGWLVAWLNVTYKAQLTDVLIRVVTKAIRGWRRLRGRASADRT